ncbi:MAG TPA: LysM peptidoglycan-binding domain-containing protein [Gemmatimonadaceae bacterium]|nr:LysM peptidoglycan-binding domain-containing protein [Gemmatimonadaceae bacterium]
MIGNFLKISSRTATRSGVRASMLGAALILSASGANTAFAQVPATPDTVPTVRTDTTNNLVMTSDTTKEVKHVVKKGDTLWDLAQFYLKNPFRWPEIFRRNTDVVENPHWIYPGEVIRIWGSEVKSTALAHADSAGEIVSHVITRPTALAEPTTTADGKDLTVFASPLSRAAAAATADVVGRVRSGGVRAGEIEAAPYADRDGGPKDAGRIVASIDRPGIKTSMIRTHYQLNDALYISLPRGLVARLGDTYMSYTLGANLGDFGEVVIPTGLLRIESLPSGQQPVARIIRQFAEIELDQRLIQAPGLPSANGTLAPVAGGPKGKVVYVHGDPVLPSIGHYVLVSLNTANGVRIGDQIAFIDNTTGANDQNAAPAVIAGLGQVVRVTRFAATTIIVGQMQPTIREGMSVRLTGKMP